MLRVENLSVLAETSDGENKIVNSLSFSVQRGQIFALVGESGCGKTMTALSIFGLLPKNCRAVGSVIFDDAELLNLRERELNKLRGDKLVLIPQSGADFLNPSLKIKTQLIESCVRAGIKGKNERLDAIKSSLLKVGLTDDDGVLNKYSFQLSGGQAQRVVLAASLIGKPALIIADEPTKGVDASTAQKFLQLVASLFTDTCIIIITHDISVARRADYVMVMHKGEIVEQGKTDDVLASPKNEYTKKLILALPENWSKYA